MIKFNELRVTQEGTALIIDAQVKDITGSENTYIDSVAIDSESTFHRGEFASSDPIYKNEEVRGQKSVRLTLTPRESFRELNINDTIFFVYITTYQNPKGEIPVGESNNTLGTAVNLYPFYQSSIYYSKELIKSCAVPKCFIDLILRIKAFNINMSTGYYLEAIKLWNKYLKGKANITSKNCNCNGSTH